MEPMVFGLSIGFVVMLALSGWKLVWWQPIVFFGAYFIFMMTPKIICKIIETIKYKEVPSICTCCKKTFGTALIARSSPMKYKDYFCYGCVISREPVIYVASDGSFRSGHGTCYHEREN